MKSVSNSSELDVATQLCEMQQMLRANFMKLHVHNTQVLARMEDIMRAGNRRSHLHGPLAQTKSASTTPSLPGIGETDIQNITTLPKSTSQGSISVRASIQSYRDQASWRSGKIDDSLRSGKIDDYMVNQCSSNGGTSTYPAASLLASSVSTDISVMSNARDMERLIQVISKHSRLLNRKSTSRHRLWVFFESRSSSKTAYCYSYFAPLFLVMSVVMSFVQTVDDWRMSEEVFSAIQCAFEIWFAAEITIRFIVCPTKWSFWCNAFNWIDLISVVPLVFRIYVWVVLKEYVSDHDVIHRVIALVPMLRMLKILRRFHQFQLLVSAFSIALEALPVLIFSLLLLAIMFAGLLYLFESRVLIPSLPSAMWFVIVTMTTVGYGDVVPETTLGKVVTAILMIFSALYMALPIGIVGNAFSEVWKDRDRLLLVTVLRESFALSGVSRSLIEEMFHQFLDLDADAEAGQDAAERRRGSEPEINVNQFHRMLRALQIDVSEERTTALFEAVDVDHGGTITCDEFIQKLFPYTFLADRVPRPSLYPMYPSHSFILNSSATSTAASPEDGVECR